MLKNKKLGGDAAIFGLSRVLGLLVQLMIITILARRYGGEGLGLLMYVQVIVQYAAVFVDFGFNSTSIRSVALCDGDSKKIGLIFGSIFVFRGVVLIISVFLIELIFFFLLKEVDGKFLRAGYLFLFGVWLIPTWLFQGVGKIRLFSYLSIFPKVTLLAVLWLIPDMELGRVSFFYFGVDFLFGLVVFAYCYKNILNYEIGFDWKLLINELRAAFDAWLGMLLVNFMWFLNPLILKNAAGVSALGDFAVLDKLVKSFHSLVWPVIQTYHADVCKRRASSNMGWFGGGVRKAVITLLFLSLLFIIAAYLIGEWIIGRLFGVSFSTAGGYLWIYSIYNFVAVLTTALIYYGYYSVGAYRKVRFMFFGQLVFFLMFALLWSGGGILKSILNVVVAELVLLFILMLGLRHGKY